MTQDEVFEALKLVILQKLGLLTRQEQLTVIANLAAWLNWQYLQLSTTTDTIKVNPAPTEDK